SIALGGATQWADETPEFLKKDAIKSTPVNVAILTYKEGDVLRFEGTSGQMTSIVHISPESSHDVTFDFYRCEDAAGYNYPIVRIGDMLWMLEDLRPQKMPNLISTSAPAIWESITPNDTAVFVQNDKAYYTVNGARKCMPKGWEVPSIDEIYALVNELQTDTTKLGDFLKDRSYDGWPKALIEGPDTLHLQLMANGYISPQGVLTNNQVTGAWVTRTTMNYGHPVTFEINALDTKLCPMVIHDKCCGFTVRGVRPAPSVYMEMIKEAFPQNEFGTSASSPKLKRPMQIIEKDGPLGDIYTFGTDRKSVFLDYTSCQYYSSGATEQRSGVLYKTNDNTDWSFESKNLVPTDVNENDPQRILRKVTAQGNADGYENVVYASWSKPFRVYFDGTTKNAVPETSSVMGEGVVNITIFGDSVKSHAILDDYATRPLLDKDGNNYLWSMPTFNGKEKLLYYNDGKYSDVRSEYFARAFNLKCIQDETGDGVDEIVMNVANKIAVFDGVTLRCLREREFADEGSYIGTANLRYDVADVNGDGYEDIVMVVNTNDVGSLQVYSKGQIDKGPIFIKALSSKSLFCDVKVGNMSGGELPDIAVLTRGVRTGANQMLEQKSCLYVSRLKYNSSLSLTEEVILSKTEVNAFASSDDLSRHVGNMDLVFGYFRGKDIKDKYGNTISYPQDLIVGDGLWRWDNAEKKPTYRFQVLGLTKSDYYTIPADAITAVQTRENDKEHLMFIWNINVLKSLTDDRPAVLSEFGEVWLGDDGTTVNRRLNFAAEVFGWGKVGTQLGSTNWTELTKWYEYGTGREINSHPTLCKFADRERPKYFKYKGHELTFTEPRVYAAIAAAPYYKGLEGSKGAATTWGKVNSEGDSDSSSDTFGGSLICGFEYSFSAPIFHAETGADFTLKASAAYTKAVETGETKSYGNSYTAGQEHVVIMQATPCDTYTYQIVRSDNPDEVGASFVISQPRTRRFVNLTLDDYRRLTASQRGVARPQWYLYGTPGKPFTYYKKSTDFDRDRIISKDYPMLVGRDLDGKESYQMVGTGESTSRSLSLAKDTTTTKTVEVGIEAELVFKNSGAKAGVGFNYNHTDQDIHRVGTEFSVEGTVPGLPSLNDPEHPQFNWNIVWYYVYDAGGIYPVVNYIVTDR
ncbi:MAG: hypothetical protein J5729_04105, partial [Bacteroidaceae bacterium]|nr:hypothetical protein [Bacteroidaceae bacterium]